jgi:hypothetical protein
MSTFFKDINDSEAGQFLALGANFSGFASVAVQVVEGIISLFSESDTDKILNAISQLQAQIQADFAQLGDLIKQQMHILQETVNRDAMATALAHTDTALFSLNTFLKTKNDADLRSASDESSNGVQFFLNLGQTPPDIFFLPGLVKAGTTRVGVIAVQDPNFFTSRPDYVAEIRQMVALLGSMIDLIKQRVNAAHVVTEKTHIVHTFPEPRVVIDGYFHQELQNTTTVLSNFFATTGLPEDEDDPRVVKARTDAENDRNRGVADELAYIGIPGLETVLQNWKTVVHES